MEKSKMTADMSADPLLEISGLRASFRGSTGSAEAVRGVDISVRRGEVLGLVGESGSGKSVTMMAMLQLLPDGSKVSGSARFDGQELVGMPADRMRRLRGKRIGVIFQDPLTSFNPVLTIGHQIAEAMRLHDRNLTERQAIAKAEHLLDQVAIPQPSRRVRFSIVEPADCLKNHLVRYTDINPGKLFLNSFRHRKHLSNALHSCLIGVRSA